MSGSTSIPAIILAGGKGTRLRSVVADRPKVLAEVCGRPYLFHLLEQLHRAGFVRVVISLGYMAQMVEDTIGHEYKGMVIKYCRETTPLGTGGGIRLAAQLVESSAYLAINGDSYCDADISSYVSWFLEKNRIASLLLSEVQNASRYGQVEVDEGQQVVSFVEKGSFSGAGLINAGLYLLSHEFLKAIPAGKFISIEQDVFPEFVGRGLLGYRAEGAFLDIGTPESYQRAESFFKKIKGNGCDYKQDSL